jgi:hypothetical protein
MLISELLNEGPAVGDKVDLEFGDTLIETSITEITQDGVVVHLDETAMRLILAARQQLAETGAPAPHRLNPQPSWMSEDDQEMAEAKYQGREVPLNKPMKGDVKKSKVYVKNAKGNVVKVNFGQKGVKIKKSIPNRRKSFRARHNCDNPGPKTSARYWSCRAW